MPRNDELRYIQAFARIIGVKEDDALEYAQRKGIHALVENASQLLSTPVQREKHQAFLDLYRMSSSINERNPIITSPELASAFFHSIMDTIHDKEAFVVAFLNTKNRIIDYDVVSTGTINSSLVHPREVFRNAIVNKANSVILCHNHPSGDLNPSMEDRHITKRLQDTGKILGIEVLDHLIINGVNQKDLYSFKANGIMEDISPYENQEGVFEGRKSYKTVKENLQEITEKLEDGIRDFFSSGRFQEYLKAMSKFHHYSFNNKILIALQKPDATLVAGYSKWQDQFQRNVKKGERGIRIIAPAPYKKVKELEKLDPLTQKPLKDALGKTIVEEVEVQVPNFRVVSVFDVSQTEGKPLPELAKDLEGNVDKYQTLFEALKRSSPVPISFETMSNHIDGYFSPSKNMIALREGMSQIQTISAAIHEIAHAKLHGQKKPEIQDPAEAPIVKDRRTEEVEAESISFSVCAYYDITTDDNSFGYIASWSKDKDLPELKASLETISNTSAELIDHIDKHFVEISKEQEKAASHLNEQVTGPAKSDKPSQPQQEHEFIVGPDDTYAIYQVKNDEALKNHRFESMEHLLKLGLVIEHQNYNLNYTGHFENVDDTIKTLNDIYEKFNIDQPQDFSGHSLSVSDVIVLKQNGELKAHYVDNFGFKELPHFLTPVNHLRSLEDSLEQNDNHFDGIINNLPPVTEKKSLKEQLKKEASKKELVKVASKKINDLER